MKGVNYVWVHKTGYTKLATHNWFVWLGPICGSNSEQKNLDLNFSVLHISGAQASLNHCVIILGNFTCDPVDMTNCYCVDGALQGQPAIIRRGWS